MRGLGKISRQADRQTGRQADRQTGRQADRQTGRQADRETDRQFCLLLVSLSQQARDVIF